MKKSVLFLIVILLGLTVESSFAGPQGFPVPDGGSTALLLAAGVSGLAWCSKRLRR
jgi:hypothetical protein